MIVKLNYAALNRRRNKTFVRYIDILTSEYIHDTVGRCNREINCGRHYTPKEYFLDNNISFDSSLPTAYQPKPIAHPKPVSFIPVEVLGASLKGHKKNHLVKFLNVKLGEEVTTELVNKYSIGTSKHWDGATVFWQKDIKGNVRTGKIMLYNPDTAKRIREPFNHITWVHKLLEQPKFELRQCFFGEHLLIDKIKPVAIVESEKTALIASVYLPDFIWLAAGNLEGLNAEKCAVLKGRNVVLYPDLNCYEIWKRKAEELSHITIFQVSDLLECKATEQEKKDGLDLADYLLKFDWRQFRKEIESVKIETGVTETVSQVDLLVGGSGGSGMKIDETFVSMSRL